MRRVTSALTTGTYNNEFEVYCCFILSRIFLVPFYKSAYCRFMNLLTLLLTDNAFWGVIPPPCETAPGCGAPCGGNMLIGGGDTAATAASGAAT